MTFSGGTTTWRASTLSDQGTLAVTGASTLNLDQSSIGIDTDLGSMNIDNNVSIVNIGQRLRASDFTIGSLATLTISSNTTTIGVPFLNLGTTRISNGATLRLSAPNPQQKNNAGAATMLDGGTLRVDGTYYVSSGVIAGTGTIVGNIRMSAAPGDVDGGLPRCIIAGIPPVIPGLAGQSGTLEFIGGTVDLRQRASLMTWIDAAGNISRINVRAQQGQGGGVMFFNGNPLWVLRDPGYTPLLGTTLTFLTARITMGGVGPLRTGWIFWPPNAWNDANGVAVRFAIAEIIRPVGGGLSAPTTINLEAIRRPPAGQGANPIPGNPVLLAPFQNDPAFVGPLSVAAVNGDPNNVGSFMALSDGSIDYVPADNFSGQDSVTYTVTDGYTYVDVVVTFLIGDTAASLSDAEYSLSHDTELSLQLDDYTSALLDNAVNFNPATVAITAVNGDSSLVGQTFTTSAGDRLTITAEGGMTYDAAVGAVYDDSFTITVSDGDNTATATITLHVVNSAPVVNDLEYATLHDQTLSVTPSQFPYGLLDNATDDDSDNLVIVAVNGNSSGVGNVVTTALGGRVVVQTDGSFIYSPPSATTGDDSFSFTVSDGIATTTANVIIHVTATAPSVPDVTFSTPHDQTLSVDASTGLLSNASGGNPLTIIAVGGQAYTPGSEALTDQGGILTVQSDGSFVYAPPAGYVGDDSVTFTIGDGTASSTATMTLFVAGVTAKDAVYTAPHDQTLTDPPSLLINATDPGGNSLSVVAINGDSTAIGSSVPTAAGGTVTVTSDGYFIYAPPTGFVGNDGFSYTVTEGISTSTANVTIHVTDAVAPDVDYTTLHDQNLTVGTGTGLLANASDADDDTLSAVPMTSAPTTAGG